MRSFTSFSLLSLTAVAILSLSGTGALAADCAVKDADGNCIGQACDNIGESTLDNDQTKVVVCLRSVKDGPLVWKSMSPSASGDNGCPAFSAPITLQWNSSSSIKKGVIPVGSALNGQNTVVTQKIMTTSNRHSDVTVELSAQCIAGSSAISMKILNVGSLLNYSGSVVTVNYHSLYDGSSFKLPSTTQWVKIEEPSDPNGM